MAKKTTEVGAGDLPLNREMFVTPGIPTVSSDLPPGEKQQMWPPTSSTEFALSTGAARRSGNWLT